MKCVNCKKESEIKIRDKNFCKNCFIKVFERNIFRAIKHYEMFSKKDKLGLLKDKNYRIILNILRKITDKRNQEIKLINKPQKNLKIILSTNLDDIAITALSNYLNNKTIKIKPNNEKLIIPLYFCSDEEIQAYSKFKNIKVSFKQDRLRRLLNEIENKYPGTKNSIVNSYLESLE